MRDKKDRLQRLNKIVEKYSEKTLQNYLGQEVIVLCEGPSKKNDEILAGYTDKNKLVNFRAPKEAIGQFVKVRVTETMRYSMNGELIAILDQVGVSH